jgi:hypothetical protein
MTFIGPGNVKTTCTPDMTDYPIDRHNCSMKIGSWTHSGDSVRFIFVFEWNFGAFADYVWLFTFIE